MSNFALYEIDQLLLDAIELADKSVDEDGNWTPDWIKFVDDLSMERERKLLACAAYLKQEQAMADALTAEVKVLVYRAHSHATKADRMAEYIKGCMAAGEKLENSQAKISWRKSVAVVIDNPSLLPENLWRIHREPDKTAIKAELLSGNLAGAAHLDERQNIVIK